MEARGRVSPDHPQILLLLVPHTSGPNPPAWLTAQKATALQVWVRQAKRGLAAFQFLKGSAKRIPESVPGLRLKLMFVGP